MSTGWVKLHRSAENHPVLANATRRGLFDRLLLRAARQPTRVSWRGRTVLLERGQLAVSVREFAAVNEVSYKEARLHLDRLAREGMIGLTPILGAAKGAEKGAGKASVGTLVTICNYDRFQLSADEETEARGAVLGTVRGAAGAQQGRTEQEVGELEEDTPLAAASLPPREEPGSQPAPLRGSIPDQLCKALEPLNVPPEHVMELYAGWCALMGVAWVNLKAAEAIRKRNVGDPLAWIGGAVMRAHRELYAATPPERGLSMAEADAEARRLYPHLFVETHQ